MDIISDKIDNNMNTLPKIISIEGNIGSGKTTIIENLQSYLKHDKTVAFLREPVDIWESIKDHDGKSILTKFYEDQHKYAFTFQVMAFMTRRDLIKKKIEEIMKSNSEVKVIICERSLEADRNIFAKMLYDDGVIDEINYQVYLRIYNEFSSEYKLDGMVYIDADAAVCHERMNRRGRDSEEGVPLCYLIKCQEYHNIWLMENKQPNMLHIDANDETNYNMNDVNDKGVKWMDEVVCFTEKIKNM